MNPQLLNRTLRSLVFALGVVLALVAGTGLAAAGDIDPYTTDDTSTTVKPSGSGSVDSSGATNNSNVVKSSNAANNSGALAFTGAETVTLALIGGGLVLGGAAFVTASRRKGTNAA